MTSIRSIHDYRYYSGNHIFKLASIEFAMFILAFVLAVITNFKFNNISTNYTNYTNSNFINFYLINQFFLSIIYSLFSCLCLYILGLYRNHMNLYIQEQYLRGFVAMLVLFFILNNISYWFNNIDAGKYVWLFSIIYSYLFFIISRNIFCAKTKTKAIKSRTIILGTGNKALELNQALGSLDNSANLMSVRQSEIIGYVHKVGDRERLPRELILNVNLNIKGNLKTNIKTNIIDSIPNPVLDYCLLNNIDTIVIAVDDRRSNFPLAQLLECKQNGITVLELIEFYEQEFGIQQLDILDPSWLIYSNHTRQTKQQETNKYILDFSLAIICFILLSPLYFLFSILLKLNFGFKNNLCIQDNFVGKYNKVFKYYKFNLYNKNNKLCITGKLILSFNKLLNHLININLQNLPSLFNVLKGDISFVGPRLVATADATELSTEIWYYKQRFAVKPGFISWGYNNINNNINKITIAKQQLQYDLYYIKKRSCLLDMVLILQNLSMNIFIPKWFFIFNRLFNVFKANRNCKKDVVIQKPIAV